MKHTIFTTLCLCFLASAFSQEIDSTQIRQTIVLKQKYVLHFLGAMDLNNTDVFNLVNQFRPQYDSVGKEQSDKAITLTSKSVTFADGMYKLSQLPEGQANQYNTDMLNAAFPQITNSWLINRMLEIRNRNWAERDARNRATALRIEQIIILQ